MRPLEGEQWRKKSLIVQSLQKGPVAPIGRNPCTYIPGRDNGHCRLSEMNFAAAVHAPPPPTFPDFVVKFAAASTVNNDSSS
ncbi:hypothetical protein Patl1_23225 [Pistacia atlantica]|uniref:Uncharacterized protein n=1 Tax=Pistacia atlantica TaxID=434234 RepID=A0ACC0ZW27_9ROSI|nr:hypothetical protein Patl1_23225 [Pistacia atlantica]